MKCPVCGEEIPNTENIEEFMDDDEFVELFAGVREQLDRLTMRSI